jgi:hypothetical protein
MARHISRLGNFIDYKKQKGSEELNTIDGILIPITIFSFLEAHLQRTRTMRLSAFGLEQFRDK